MDIALSHANSKDESIWRGWGSRREGGGGGTDFTIICKKSPQGKTQDPALASLSPHHLNLEQDEPLMKFYRWAFILALGDPNDLTMAQNCCYLPDDYLLKPLVCSADTPDDLARPAGAKMNF